MLKCLPQGSTTFSKLLFSAIKTSKPKLKMYYLNSLNVTILHDNVLRGHMTNYVKLLFKLLCDTLYNENNYANQEGAYQ